MRFGQFDVIVALHFTFHPSFAIDQNIVTLVSPYNCINLKYVLERIELGYRSLPELRGFYTEGWGIVGIKHMTGVFSSTFFSIGEKGAYLSGVHQLNHRLPLVIYATTLVFI